MQLGLKLPALGLKACGGGFAVNTGQLPRVPLGLLLPADSAAEREVWVC